MAVGVEAETRLHPLTAYGILRCGAPNPPLRQAAGRYATYALLLWCAESNLYDINIDANVFYAVVLKG